MELKLPTTIVSRADVTRLSRELANLNDFFIAAASRPSGTAISPPKLSRLLDQLAKANNCNLLEEKQRQVLLFGLQQLVKVAPMLHISFAADPSTRALETILIWLRANIHSQVLLQVGLQPNIAAGCVLRTPNRWFDMSLRSRLQKQEPYLLELMAGAARE